MRRSAGRTSLTNGDLEEELLRAKVQCARHFLLEDHDHILVYARNGDPAWIQPILMPRTDKQNKAV